jgi:hypothetical protein
VGAVAGANSVARETLDSAWEDMLARRRAGIDRRNSANHLCLDAVECAVREQLSNRSTSSELAEVSGAGLNSSFFILSLQAKRQKEGQQPE